MTADRSRSWDLLYKHAKQQTTKQDRVKGIGDAARYTHGTEILGDRAVDAVAVNM